MSVIFISYIISSINFVCHAEAQVVVSWSHCRVLCLVPIQFMHDIMWAECYWWRFLLNPLLITILPMFCPHVLFFRHVIGLPSLHVVTVLVFCRDFTVDPALGNRQEGISLTFPFFCPSFQCLFAVFFSTVLTSCSVGLWGLPLHNFYASNTVFNLLKKLVYHWPCIWNLKLIPTNW
jgi:hypothetical protein